MHQNTPLGIDIRNPRFGWKLQGKLQNVIQTADGVNPYKRSELDFAEFRPPRFIRIPFEIDKPVKQARIYATSHGIYEMEINGAKPDDRKFAPTLTFNRNADAFLTGWIH